MFETEEDIKIKIVLPYLQGLGFDASELHFEDTLKLKLGTYWFNLAKNEPAAKASGRYDVLVTRNGTNLFVVEVKGPGIELTEDDRDQSCSYAKLIHPVAPFAVVTNGKDWRLYDSLTKAEIPSGDFKVRDTYTVALPDALYYDTLKFFLGFSKDNLLTFCGLQVKDGMIQLEGSSEDRDKKYISDLYEPWENLDHHMGQFMNSPARSFVVTGDPGSGKSCWICHTAKEYLANGFPVLFYRGSHSGGNIFAALSEDMNWNLPITLIGLEGPKRFFDVFKEEPVLVFIDGLDEIGISRSVEMIDTFLRRTAHMNVKVIGTCKSTNWPSFLRDRHGVATTLSNNMYLIGNQKGYRLTELEEPQFRRMLLRYQQFYGFRGGIEQSILSECKRQPFLLQVVFEVAASVGKENITYSSAQFYDHYIALVCERTEEAELVKRILPEIAASFYKYDAEVLEMEQLRKHLGLGLLEDIPPSLFHCNILERREEAGLIFVAFYYQKIRDYLIAMRELRLPSKSAEELLATVRGKALKGIHRAVITLYYSQACEDHKRALDGHLFQDAVAYADTYEEILDGHFSSFKPSFDPGTPGTIGFIGYFDLSSSALISYGFRSVENPQDRVLFLPASSEWRSDDLAFIEGAKIMKSRLPSAWGRGMDTLTEVVWHEIGPSLDEITKRGILNESQNRELLLERVLATYMTYLRAAGERNANTTEDVLPVTLDYILRTVFYYRAKRVLTEQRIEELFRQRTLNICWRDNRRLLVPELSMGEVNVLLSNAWRTAVAGNFVHDGGHSVHSARWKFVEQGLYDDVKTLQGMGVEGINKDSVINWQRYPFSSNCFELVSEDLLQRLAALYQRYLDEYLTLCRVNFPTFWNMFPFAERMPVKCFIWIEGDGNYRGFRVATCDNRGEGHNSVIPCVTDEIRVEDDRFVITYQGESHQFFKSETILLFSVLFPGAVVVNSGFMPFRIDVNLTPLRQLVYKALRNDLKIVFPQIARQLGAVQYAGRILFT